MKQQMKQQILKVPEYRMSRWVLALYAFVFVAAIVGIFAIDDVGALWAGLTAVWVAFAAYTEYVGNQRARIAYMRGVVDTAKVINENLLGTAVNRVVEEVAQHEATKQPN